MNIFLKKLVAERKVVLVGQNGNLAHAYAEKSRNSLKAAKILRREELPEEATTMAYYAMYHQALALLFSTGIKSENHAATAILLAELFVVDGDALAAARRTRVKTQYYADAEMTRAKAETLIREAETFTTGIRDRIDRLTTTEKAHIRAEFSREYL